VAAEATDFAASCAVHTAPKAAPASRTNIHFDIIIFFIATPT